MAWLAARGNDAVQNEKGGLLVLRHIPKRYFMMLK